MSSTTPVSGTSTIGYNTVGDKVIQFGSGLDTNTDPFVLSPPYVTTASNIFFLSPGQIQALPIVANPFSVGADVPVHTAAPLPTLEPTTTGSFYEIKELTKSLLNEQLSVRSPYMAIRDWTTNEPVGPLAPMYPYTVQTRQLLGQVGTGGGPTGSLLSTVSPLDPTRVLTLTNAVDNSANVVLTLTDTTGNTICQTAYEFAGSSLAFAPFRLISDPVVAGTHYLLASCINGSTQTVSYYTVTVPLSTNNTAPLAINVDAGGLLAPAATVFDVEYVNGRAVAFWNTNSGTANTLWWYVLTPTSHGSFDNVPPNSTGHQDYTAAATGVPTLAVTATAGLNVPGTTYLLYWGIAGQVFAMPMTAFASAGAVQSFSLPGGTVNTPQTIIARATNATPLVADVVVFSHYIETFNSLTTQGWPTTTNTQYVQQISSTFLRASGSGGAFDGGNTTSYYRSIQGALIVAKAFAPNMYNAAGAFVGTSPETFFCPIVLGAFDFDTTPNGATSFFVLDHFCRVASQFNNDGSAPLVTTNYLTPPASQFQTLSQPLFFASPNEASLFDVGFPYQIPNVLQTYQPYSITNQNNLPSQSSSTSKTYAPIRTTYNNLVNLFFMSYQAQGALPAANPARSGRGIILSGGMTMHYDNRTLHEAGYCTFAKPPGPATFTGTSTQFPANIQLEYQVIYTWTDAQGLRHISSPMNVAYFVNPASPTGSSNISFFLQAPPFTYKDSPNVDGINVSGNPVIAEVYASKAQSGSDNLLYYKGSVTMPFGANDAPSGLISDLGRTFIDTAGVPADLNFQLYTNRQEYVSSPAPSFIWTLNNQGRTYGLACVNGTYRVYFTDVYNDINPTTIQPVAPRFNLNGFLTVPPELGDCRSLGQMDDKVLIFGTRGIAFFSGAGPGLILPSGNVVFTQTDITSVYSPVTPITVPAGVVGCGSPVTIPQGIVYQDRQGMTLMSRGLSPSFVGKPITEVTASARYGNATVLPKLQLVLFPNTAGPSLVMEYNSGMWSQWAAVGACTTSFFRADGTMFVSQSAIGNGTVAATQTVQVYPSGTTAPVSASANNDMVVETPWLPIGQGISGEGDMWDMVLLGKYLAPHTLTIESAFNYGAYAQTTVFMPGVDATLPTLPYQYRVRPQTNARMQSVRYRITIAAVGAQTTTECARITGLMLYTANYRGLQRLGAVASR